MDLDFGEYKLSFKKNLHPTPGVLSVCQALSIAYFTEAGFTGLIDEKNITASENAKAQLAIKKLFDDECFLEIIDEVFDVSASTVIGPEKYENRNKVKLSEVLNAPVLDGSGIDIKKLITIRADIVNFLSVG